MDRAIKIASKRLLGAVRKAVQDYDMIRHGDRIGRCFRWKRQPVSLWALAKLKEFFPEKYHLEAVTINLGLGDPGWKRLLNSATRLEKHTIEETLIGRIVFERRKEENPCSLCANMRRGALHDVALRLGATRWRWGTTGTML